MRCNVADLEPEGHDSILLGAYVLVRENGQDHLRQIKTCKPDAGMEPVIVTQVHHRSTLQSYGHLFIPLSKCVSMFKGMSTCLPMYEHSSGVSLLLFLTQKWVQACALA